MYSKYTNELKEVLTNITGNDFDSFISRSIETFYNTLQSGNKILLAGNGGSSADASHFAAEFTGRYKLERKGLPFLCLSSDTSFMTAWSNDYDFESIFKRQVESFGTANDILFLISTSGNSKNLIEAAKEAKKRNIKVISILGKSGGGLKDYSDLSYIVPSDNTPRIQEMHILIIHIISEEIENKLFGNN